MAIGATLEAKVSSTAGLNIPPVAVASICSDWTVIHGDVTTADNSGSAITTPSTQIVDADAQPLDTKGKGTCVILTVQYTASRTLSTDPIFNLFGLDGSGATPIAGIPSPLLTQAASYDWTFADDATNDANDGTYKYTRPQIVDLQGLRYFVAGVKTAGILSSTGTAKLLARIL